MGAPLQSREFEISRPTILVIAVNPSLGPPGGGEPGDAGKLALDQELADIRRELLVMAPHHDFELVWEEAVTVDDLMRLLIKFKPIAVHFAGHGVAGDRGAAGPRYRDVEAITGGGAAAGIVLLDEHHQPLVVTADALAQMVASVAPAVRLLVLNACHSEAQASVLSHVVDAVITMNGAIRDDSARSFAVAFYRALGYRHPVGEAFSHAKATLAGKGCPDEDLPRLHTRNGVRANDIVLARGPARWPRLDTGRFRELIRRQTQRGHLVAAAVAAAMIAGWAALATFVLADDYTTDPRATPNRPASTPPAARGRSETEPELLAPTPRPDAEEGRQLTGSAPPADAPDAPPPALCATDEMRPAPEAPEATDAPPAAPGASDAPVPGSPSTPRPAPRAAQLAASPAKPARPGASPAKPAGLDDTGAPGELDREIVRRYIARYRDPIRYCYEQQRMTRPTLAGTVKARFFIAPQGRVVSSAASGLDDQVASCVAGVIKDIEFPSSGTGVQVVYPFHFVPNDAGITAMAGGSDPALP